MTRHALSLALVGAGVVLLSVCAALVYPPAGFGVLGLGAVLSGLFLVDVNPEVVRESGSTRAQRPPASS